MRPNGQKITTKEATKATCEAGYINDSIAQSDDRPRGTKKVKEAQKQRKRSTPILLASTRRGTLAG